MSLSKSMVRLVPVGIDGLSLVGAGVCLVQHGIAPAAALTARVAPDAQTFERFRELIEETNDAVHEEALKAFQAGEKEG